MSLENAALSKTVTLNLSFKGWINSLQSNEINLWPIGVGVGLAACKNCATLQRGSPPAVFHSCGGGRNIYSVTIEVCKNAVSL